MPNENPPQPIPVHVETWAIKVPKDEQADVLLTYGNLHEIMHRDISIGNEFRKERIKHLITLATAIFALTVTFHSEILGGKQTDASLQMLWLGWLLLLGSLISGIFHWKKWEDFYLGHRNTGKALWEYHVYSQADNQARKANAQKDWHKAVRSIQDHQNGHRILDPIQTGFLVLGMAFLALATGLSLSNAAPLPPADSVDESALIEGQLVANYASLRIPNPLKLEG